MTAAVTLSPELAHKVDAASRLLADISRDHSPAAFASSLGAEDMVLTDLIWRSDLAGISVFSLDTGRLPAETYALLARLQRHYGRSPTLYFPRHDQVETYVNTHGINGFYQSVELRKACCHARKVEPLRRALAGQRAWITGLRAQQAPERSGVAVKAFDADHGLDKFNPLADWTEEEVWEYLRARQVPVNALHAQGYPSIGCAPCTRAISPGEPVRAGRWWWEDASSKECGLHVARGAAADTAA